MKTVKTHLDAIEEIMSSPVQDIFQKEASPVAKVERSELLRQYAKVSQRSARRSQNKENLLIIANGVGGYGAWLLSGALNLTIKGGGALLVLGFRFLFGLVGWLASGFTALTDRALAVEDYDWSQPKKDQTPGGNIFNHSVSYKGDGFSVRCDTTIKPDN